MPEALPALATFFASGPGEAIAGGAATAAVGAGTAALLAPHPHINIPPPPGAAMIDPAGAMAAAQIRQRQAVAGGLESTVTGAGFQPTVGATSGGKSLLGQ